MLLLKTLRLARKTIIVTEKYAWSSQHLIYRSFLECTVCMPGHIYCPVRAVRQDKLCEGLDLN